MIASRPPGKRPPDRRRYAARAYFTGLACCTALACACCAPQFQRLEPISATESTEATARCRELFPSPPWRATHRIDATLPLGHKATLIGAVASETGGFRSALMTQEGFVVLDLTYHQGSVEVHRAVAPVDSDEFGANMASDIDLLMQEPVGPLLEVGRTASGAAVCRWEDEAGTVVDARLTSHGAELLRYDGKGHLLRRATLEDIGTDGIAQRMTIEASGPTGYHLELRRLEPAAPTPD